MADGSGLDAGSASPTEGFPRDDYTGHGYLANPYAYARSWSDGHGGNIRSADTALGFGWLYPWALNAKAGARLEIALVGGDGPLVTRADFESAGLATPHHSSLLFEHSWTSGGITGRARFVLAGEDELGVEIELEAGSSLGEMPSSPQIHALILYLAAVAWRRDGGDCVADGSSLDLGDSFPKHHLVVDGESTTLGTATRLADLVRGEQHARSRGDQAVVVTAIPLTLAVGEISRAHAILRRGEPESPSQPAGPRVRAAIEAARERDDQFWRGAARLAGDWPASWRRGWVYDLETTRMCIFPAGGVFADVWPAWMIQWPRAVLAEGSLDALRLSYADPALAKRATLSLFRDTPGPNVPCIFQRGEPNMVAADGSICGTSPAWCVPFYNLERLYLRTLDRPWLTALYPFLAGYLDWWLAERTDADGWATYKCTWEAGEDDTPRLDPELRGDNVVSEYVRPVELQATMALSAGVLERFATLLGRPDDALRWRAVADAFEARTRALWDPAEGRFRDWDRRYGRFLEPSGESNYWGIDPCRYSALAFTPLLAGLATAEQRQALAGELEAYTTPPWTLWASWSYVVLESALAAGERRFAGRVAAGIVARVYEQLDRRRLGNPPGPTPGIAREYWPLDVDAWDGSEGYGWGATTASYVVRQLFGFTEGGYPAAGTPSDLSFRLAPTLPEAFLEPARRYALLNLPYRGAQLDIEYTVLGDPRGALDVRIGAGKRTRCRVTDQARALRYESETARDLHHFTVSQGTQYEVSLRP